MSKIWRVFEKDTEAKTGKIEYICPCMGSTERLAMAIKISEEIQILLKKRKCILSSSISIENDEVILSIDSEIDSKTKELDCLGQAPFWLDRVL